MQSLRVKVNGTNPIPTIFVLYIMIPFSNSSKHKKNHFQLVSQRFFVLIYYQNAEKILYQLFSFSILYNSVFTVSERFRPYASRPFSPLCKPQSQANIGPT